MDAYPIDIYMRAAEGKLISKYLNSKKVMLEWGAGGSTVYFSKLVKQYISIEHNLEWYNKVKKEIGYNVKLYCVPNSGYYNSSIPTKAHQFKNYINYIDTLNTKYDVVLIDGRARVECAKKVIPYLNKDAVVFIHDFWARPPLQKALEFYDEIESIKNGDTLVALKVKL